MGKTPAQTMTGLVNTRRLRHGVLLVAMALSGFLAFFGVEPAVANNGAIVKYVYLVPNDQQFTMANYEGIQWNASQFAQWNLGQFNAAPDYEVVWLKGEQSSSWYVYDRQGFRDERDSEPAQTWIAGFNTSREVMRRLGNSRDNADVRYIIYLQEDEPWDQTQGTGTDREGFTFASGEDIQMGVNQQVRGYLGLAHEAGHMWGLPHQGPDEDCMQFGFFNQSCFYAPINRDQVRAGEYSGRFFQGHTGTRTYLQPPPADAVQQPWVRTPEQVSAFGLGEQMSAPTTGSFESADASGMQVLADAAQVVFNDNDATLDGDSANNELGDDGTQEVVVGGTAYRTYVDFSVNYAGSDGNEYRFGIVDVHLSGLSNPDDGRFLVLTPGQASPPVGTTLTLIPDSLIQPADLNYSDIRVQLPTPTPVPPTPTPVPPTPVPPTPTPVPPTPEPTPIPQLAAEFGLKVNCVDGVGEIEVSLTSTGQTSTYTVEAPGVFESRVVTEGTTVLLTIPDLADGSVPVTVSRDGAASSPFSVMVSCGGAASTPAPQPPVDSPGDVSHVVTCLAGNGRADIAVVNSGSDAATYRVVFEGLSARSATVAPGDWWRLPITGRADGPYDLTVTRNGTVVAEETLVVACDGDSPQVTGPEVSIINACRFGNGYLLFQFVNATDAGRGWVIEFEGVPNRSTSATAFGAAVRAVTGRQSGDHDFLVRTTTGETILTGTVTVDC